MRNGLAGRTLVVLANKQGDFTEINQPDPSNEQVISAIEHHDNLIESYDPHEIYSEHHKALASINKEFETIMYKDVVEAKDFDRLKSLVSNSGFRIDMLDEISRKETIQQHNDYKTVIEPCVSLWYGKRDL